MAIMGWMTIIASFVFFLFLLSSGGFEPDDIERCIVFGFAVLMAFGMGLFFVLISYKAKKKRNSLPENLIIYDNGELIFADGYRCSPIDLTSVEYFRSRTRSKIATTTNNFGTLKVNTKDRVFEYTGVDMVECAHSRLIYYMEQAYE